MKCSRKCLSYFFRAFSHFCSTTTNMKKTQRLFITARNDKELHWILAVKKLEKNKHLTFYHETRLKQLFDYEYCWFIFLWLIHWFTVAILHAMSWVVLALSHVLFCVYFQSVVYTSFLPCRTVSFHHWIDPVAGVLFIMLADQDSPPACWPQNTHLTLQKYTRVKKLGVNNWT